MGAEPHFNHNYGTGLEWYRLEPQVEVSDRNRSMRPPVQTLGHTVLFTTLQNSRVEPVRVALGLSAYSMFNC